MTNKSAIASKGMSEIENLAIKHLKTYINGSCFLPFTFGPLECLPVQHHFLMNLK